ncbi:hypothetical protein NLJ89_g11841 [Agrocybe chaxingu]|uniref:Uncharacterized protein n=1 Tax=Agrocybe chaxingu TaxID=84603 RepID=A0A9W8JNL4_9AGAR|nr:hypothetical protein NLJ89_g11841 [Agrocybe chaxingu]
MASSSSTNSAQDRNSEQEWKEAMSALGKHLRPDPITGELEDTDILRFITENADHPDVVRFFQVSEKRNSSVKEKRAQEAATFDPTKLKIQYGATWVVSLEYSGLTTDERLDDKLYQTKEEAKAREKELQGPAKATFQLFCYIREGPEIEE